MMSDFKELNDFPEELKAWGEVALSRVESPEKRHEAANDLRQKMEGLWNECSLEKPEEKLAYVLSQLGDAETVADEMRNTYVWKEKPKTDRVIGSIVLILSAFCGVYAFMAFFVFPNEEYGEASIYANYLTGKGAGSGAACAILFFVLGVMILLNSRKKGK